MFFSFVAYHRILSTVPCAMQQDLVVYPSRVQKLTSANRPRLQPPQPHSLGCHQFVLERQSQSPDHTFCPVLFSICI